MAEKNLAGFRVAILATDGFEESELTKPRQALEENGAECVVIAPRLRAQRRSMRRTGFVLAGAAIAAGALLFFGRRR